MGRSTGIGKSGAGDQIALHGPVERSAGMRQYIGMPSPEKRLTGQRRPRSGLVADLLSALRFALSGAAV
jgi:hypothetical protein